MVTMIIINHVKFEKEQAIPITQWKPITVEKQTGVPVALFYF